jgi:pimeloyl-ACP methyl ester carboxylesterase
MPRPTLLLLHGFPLDSTLWAPQQALHDVADVVALDLPGFGADATPVPEVLTMEHLADAAMARLDALGSRTAVICGLSMGGYVAMACWARHPERVKGLVLCNTRMNADTEEGRRSREETARTALEKGVGLIARAMVPKLLAPATHRSRPALGRQLEAMIARQRPEAVAAAARGMAVRPDRQADLMRVNVPALVITGDRDELMPLPTSLAMRDTIPGCALAVVPGAAHLPNLERADLFNATIRDFLRDLPDA